MRNWRRRTQARSALGWGVLLFLLMQLGLGLGMELLWPLMRFPTARQVLARLPVPGDEALILFLGSSRTGCAIDTRTIAGLCRARLPEAPIPRMYNAAVPAGDPITYEFLLEQCLERGCRPSWVVVEISPENLKDPNPWMMFHAERQLGWRHLRTHLVETVRASSGWRYLGSLLLPGYVHRQQMARLVNEQLVEPEVEQDTEAGIVAWDRVLVQARPSTPEELAQRLKEGSAAARRWLRDYQVGGQAAAALERLLQRCQAEQIRVVLLMPPLARGYREEYQPAIEAAFQTHLARLRSEYGCALVDGRDWLADEYFRDPGHAERPEGSSRFSERLTRELVLPQLLPGLVQR